MKLEDFEMYCPQNAHLSSFNFKGKEHEVVSAKGYNLIAGDKQKGGGAIPGTLSLVWNKFGEAYSREMAITQSTDFKELNCVIIFDGQVYQRDKRYDIKFPAAQ